MNKKTVAEIKQNYKDNTKAGRERKREQNLMENREKQGSRF